MKAKIYILILFTFLSGISFVNAQVDKLEALRTSKKIVSVSKLPASPDYAIQIIALKLPAEEPGFFNKIDYAREFSCEDGYVRYCVESFASFREAQSKLDYYKELGYNQSFVVNTAKYRLVEGSVQNFDPNATYTVQLSAFRFPVYLSHFEGLDNVMEFYSKDKIFRYTVGSYSHEEAVQALEEIKAKGFKDAFVTKLDPYLPYQIE